MTGFTKNCHWGELMRYIMGPYLIFERNEPSYWLSWSMDGEYTQHVFISKYFLHNSKVTHWSEHFLNESAEYFYAYDAAPKEGQPSVFCLVFNQRKVYRIQPRKLLLNDVETVSVKQVERLGHNDKTWFFHVDPYFQAREIATPEQMSTLNSYDISRKKMPKLGTRLTLLFLQRYKILTLPKELGDVSAEIPGHSEEILNALNIDVLVKKINNPDCLLLANKPKKFRHGKLYIWIENLQFHYGWLINGALLKGHFDSVSHLKVVQALEIMSELLEQESVLHVREYLEDNTAIFSMMIAACLGLSANQQMLIVSRMELDGIWPSIEEVSDPSLLTTLLCNYLRGDENHDLPDSLRDVCNGFHEFTALKKLLMLEQNQRFYDPSDSMIDIANQANLRNVCQFIQLIVLMALKELRKNIIHSPRIMISADYEHKKIGEALTASIIQEGANFSEAEALVYQLLSLEQVDILEYSTEQLQSALSLLKAVLERHPSAVSLSDLIFMGYQAEILQEIELTQGELSEHVYARIRQESEGVLKTLQHGLDIHRYLSHWDPDELSTLLSNADELEFVLRNQQNVECINDLIQLLLSKEHLICLIIDINDYKKLWEMLEENPILIPVVMPYLADSHDWLFPSRDELDSFLRDLGSESKWFDALSCEMEEDFLSICKFQSFLECFDALSQQAIKAFFRSKFTLFVQENLTVSEVVEQDSALENVRFIRMLSQLNMSFSPKHLNGFQAATEERLLLACASKLDLSSKMVFFNWLQQVHDHNRTVMIRVAAQVGFFEREIRTHEDCCEVLTHLHASEERSLFLILYYPWMYRLANSISELEDILMYFDFPQQTQLVYTLLSHSSVERMLCPWLRFDGLSRSNIQVFFNFWLEMFQRICSTEAELRQLNTIAFRFSCRNERRRIMVTQSAFFWLKSRLLGCESGFETLDNGIQHTLSSNPNFLSLWREVEALRRTVGWVEPSSGYISRSC